MEIKTEIASPWNVTFVLYNMLELIGIQFREQEIFEMLL